MRYRELDANGDMQLARWLADSPEAVGQAVMTRLLLNQGEWFLDQTEGTPYQSKILGTGHQAQYDWAIRDRILRTEGVTELTAYDSQIDPDTRALTVQATINTRYGETILEATL